MRPVTRIALVSALFTFRVIAAAQPAPRPTPPAPPSGVKRALLQRIDVPVSPQHECVFGSAELAPGASIGRHFHDGYEIGYVLEGEAEVTVDGEPAKHMKAGESYRIDPRKPHDVRNVGTGPAKAIATWIVEKGKPLATPVK